MATQVWNFEDEKSFVSTTGHLVLWGKDKSKMREMVYGRAQGKCQTCGKEAPLETAAMIAHDKGWITDEQFKAAKSGGFKSLGSGSPAP